MIKRFIAGAVCPKCNERDKLRAWGDDQGNQHRECVRCGFVDVLRADAPAELATRVNQPRKSPTTQSDISPVKIIGGSSND